MSKKQTPSDGWDSLGPSNKDVLYTVVGGIIVGLLAAAANVAAFYRSDSHRALTRSIMGQPVVMISSLLLVMALATSVPRIFHPAPWGRVRSEDRTTYSPGYRFSRGRWAIVAAVSAVLNVLLFVFAERVF